MAADYARPAGEWAPFERASGIRQWAFRGQPVYRFLGHLGFDALDAAIEYLEAHLADVL